MTKQETLPDTMLKNLAHAAGIQDYRAITNVHTQKETHGNKVTLDVTVTINLSQKELKELLK